MYTEFNRDNISDDTAGAGPYTYVTRRTANASALGSSSNAPDTCRTSSVCTGSEEGSPQPARLR